MQAGQQVVGSKGGDGALARHFKPLTVTISVPGEGSFSLAVCWAISAFKPDAFRWLDWSGFAWESDGAGTWSSPERAEYGYACDAIEVGWGLGDHGPAMRVAS